MGDADADILIVRMDSRIQKLRGHSTEALS